MARAEHEARRDHEEWPSLGEEDLSMTRTKPRSRLLVSCYRAARVGRWVLGTERMLRLCLDASWALRRIAFEISGEVYGESFHQVSMGLSDDLLRQQIPPGGSVLDVGCGRGRWCRAAALYAGAVVGIDSNATHIETARRLNTSDRIVYLVADASKDVAEVVAGRRFDLALLIHVIEHVEDVDALLRSMHRVAPTMLVEVPDFEGESLNLVRRRTGTIWYSDADHVREYTGDLLRQQLERNGWRVRLIERRGGAVLAVTDSDFIDH